MFDAYGETNAHRVQNRIRRKVQAHTLLQFRRIARTLIKGPDSILVRRNTSDYNKLSDFQLVSRIALQSINRVSSWAIYQEEQNEPHEKVPGCVLRYVTWDAKADLESRSWESENSPRVTMVTRYIEDEPYCGSVMQSRLDLDAILIDGITLEPRPETNTVEWYGIEIYRLFERSYFELGWNSSMQNLRCEIALINLAKTIEETLHEHQLYTFSNIEALEMIYDSPSQEAMELLLNT